MTDIPNRITADSVTDYPGAGSERRRRLEFLLRVLDAPTGITRPVAEIEFEIELLIKEEWDL